MYTFFTSRPAIMLPCVERRSPAMTTPPGYFNATIVVPCGSWALAPPAAPGWAPPPRLAGSNSGAWRRRKSANEDRSTAGIPGSAELVDRRSENGQVTVRLLDIRADKVLGVFLKNVVNLVEQVVGVLGQLLAALLARGRGVGEVVIVAAATATLGLLLSHRRLLLCYRPRHTPAGLVLTLPVGTDVSLLNDV